MNWLFKYVGLLIMVAEEIREILIQVSFCAGGPAGLEATRVADKVSSEGRRINRSMIQLKVCSTIERIARY